MNQVQRKVPHTSQPSNARPPRSGLATVFAVLVAVVSTIYLLNPTAGFLEILPDNLPVVGNLDEAFFTFALLASVSSLGLSIPFLRRG